VYTFFWATLYLKGMNDRGKADAALISFAKEQKPHAGIISDAFKTKLLNC